MFLMSRKYRTLGLMLLVCTAFGIAALVLQPTSKTSEGKISILNIGQGDAILITAPSGAQMLIDGGKDSKVLSELNTVMPIGDHSIDVVVATHPDADHIGGLPLVIERYDIGLFITSQVMGDTQTYRDLMNGLYKHKIPSYFAHRGETIALDPVTTFKILFPDRDVTSWETNTASVVGRLDIGPTSGGVSALFNGDSPISIERYLVQTDPKDLDVDILKLGHHGSKTSLSEEYLKATSPALALISAGVNNRYGHPAPEVMRRLQKLSIPSVSTQDRGTITLRTDGVKWFMSK